jgi:hypothetical protein
VNQDNSGGSSGGMTPVFLPYNQLGAYKALNLNLNINIVTITQIAIGNQIQQVALALISQKN